MKLAFIWTTSCDVLTPNVTSLGMVVREARAPIMIKVVTVFSARVEEESVVSPYVVVKPRLARKRVCAAIYTSLLWQGDDRPKATSCRRHRRNFYHEFWPQHKTKTWPFSCFRQCISIHFRQQVRNVFASPELTGNIYMIYDIRVVPWVLGASATFVNVAVRPTTCIVNVTFQQILTLYFKKYNLLWVYLFYLLKNMSLDVLVK